MKSIKEHNSHSENGRRASLMRVTYKGRKREGNEREAMIVLREGDEGRGKLIVGGRGMKGEGH